MGDPITAAWDPLFYGHHANVDRYWCYWEDKYCHPDYGPPSDTKFYYFDETGEVAEVVAGDLLDPRKLGYYYEQLPTRPVLQTSELISAECAGDLAILDDKKWGRVLDYLSTLLASPAFGAISSSERSLKTTLALLGNLPRVVLICNVEASPSEGVQTGIYYSVELSNGSKEGGTVVGGFGVFMESHGPESIKVRPAVELDLEAIASLQRSAPPSDDKQLKLYYGQAAPATGGRDARHPPIVGRRALLNISKFAIQIPIESTKPCPT
jgi:hypothetical protein